MTTIQKVEQRVRLGKTDIIKYQLLTYCFLNRIPVAEGELECLALLANKGPQELGNFCNQAAVAKIYASAQTARNSLIKSEKKGLALKEGKTRKRIMLNPNIKLQTAGNILLDFKFVFIHDTTKV